MEIVKVLGHKNVVSVIIFIILMLVAIEVTGNSCYTVSGCSHYTIKI